MRSARCFGVYVSGDRSRVSATFVNGAAHWPQNLFSGGLLAPHDAQTAARRAAHWPQNFMPERVLSLAPGTLHTDTSNLRKRSAGPVDSAA